MKPKISVVVPVYNVEQYLKRCLDSIVNQTLYDIEIICVNDGSTDGSLKILEEYAENDKRIQIINQKNSGISVARNTGLKHARGEYTSFIDSDDWIDLDFYEKMYQSAVDSDSDIAICGRKRVCSNKETIEWKMPNRKISISCEDKFRLTNCPNVTSIWDKIYKTKFLLDTNILFEEGRVCEDRLWLPQIIYFANRVVTVPDVYYYYFRGNRTSITRKRNKKFLEDREYSINFVKEFLKQKNLNLDDFLHETETYKFLGLRILRIDKIGKVKKYNLLGFIKWETLS